MIFKKYIVDDEKYNQMSKELLQIDDPVEYNKKVEEINTYAESIGIKNRVVTYEKLYGDPSDKPIERPVYNGLLMIWKKYGKKRGYLTESAIEKALVLEVERYKSGNAKYVTQDGYEISNSQYNRIIVRFVNQYFDFISKRWSFELKGDNEKRIDDFFRNNGEIC